MKWEKIHIIKANQIKSSIHGQPPGAQKRLWVYHVLFNYCQQKKKYE